MKHRSLGSAPFVPLALLAVVVACSSSKADLPSWGTGPAPVPPPQEKPFEQQQKYAGIGSEWQFTFTPTPGSKTAGTFTAAESTTSTSFSGTFARSTDPSNPTGFVILKNTVSPSDTGQAPKTVLSIPAIELPGIEMMIAPILPGEKTVINAIAVGGCPTVGFEANYIYTQGPGGQPYNSASDQAGVFSYDPSTSSFEILKKFSPTNDIVFSNYVPSSISGTCSNSVWTVPALDGKLYLNPVGGGLLHTTKGDTAFGFPAQRAGTVTLQSLAGNYVGFAFSSTKVTKVMMVLPASASGNVVVTKVDDSDLNASVPLPMSQVAAIKDVSSYEDLPAFLDFTNAKFDTPAPGFFLPSRGAGVCTAAVKVNNTDLNLITCQIDANEGAATLVLVSHHARVPTCGFYNCSGGCCLPDGTCQGGATKTIPPYTPGSKVVPGSGLQPRKDVPRTVGQPFSCGRSGAACEVCKGTWGTSDLTCISPQQLAGPEVCGGRDCRTDADCKFGFCNPVATTVTPTDVPPGQPVRPVTDFHNECGPKRLCQEIWDCYTACRAALPAGQPGDACTTQCQTSFPAFPASASWGALNNCVKVRNCSDGKTDFQSCVDTFCTNERKACTGL